MTDKFKLGLVINPIAGIGGSVALKGSDGEGIAKTAIALGAKAQSNKRASLALSILQPYAEKIIIYTANGDMGFDTASSLGFETQVIYSANEPTLAIDTENTVQALINVGVDIILFAGGDGTARAHHATGRSDHTAALALGADIHG